MKLKTVEVGGKVYAEVQDGAPIYIHDDGKEIPFDGVSAAAKVKELNGEAMGRRKELREAQERLAAFEGIDAAAARDALDKMTKIDQKKLIDAGEIDKVRSEIKASYDATYKPIVEERDKLKSALDKEMIGGAFGRSAFIKEKVISPSLAEALFRSNIKLEDGKLVAYDGNGQKIYSRSKPGEPADFEEAIETLVSASPDRDNILKSTGANGMGVKPQGGGQGGGKVLSQEQFAAMTPKDRAAAFAAGATLAAS